MSKFLTSRTTAPKGDELDVLTAETLRTLIPGDFCLLQIPRPEGGVIPGPCSNCILMLHEKGIFVFLYEQRFGLIHGNVWDKTWTSTDIMGEKAYFSSPYLRNRQNIRTLAGILKLPEDRFHSCIVFNSECDTRKAPKENNLTILHIEQLEEKFAKLLPTLPVQYTHLQLEALRDIFLVVITGGRVQKQPQ